MIAARPPQPRPRSYILPILLIVGGAVLLLANSGVLNEDAGWRLLALWPLILVMIGLQLVATRLFSGRAASAVALVAVALVALLGMAYVVGGPAAGGTYTRFTSSAATAGATAGTLTIDAAGSRVQLTGADLGDQLYQANVDYAGQAPRVTYSAGDLRIASGPVNGLSWNRKADVIAVNVNASIPWTVVVNSAGVTVRMDLANGDLRSFTLNGVGSTADLSLGAPAGTVPITLNGVGTSATVGVPQGTEYRTSADGLATVVSGVRETAGFAAAADRYEIAAKGVGARLTVEARD